MTDVTLHVTRDRYVAQFYHKFTSLDSGYDSVTGQGGGGGGAGLGAGQFSSSEEEGRGGRTRPAHYQHQHTRRRPCGMGEH